MTEVKKSKDLNDVIKAHGSFLVEITTGCLLDDESYVSIFKKRYFITNFVIIFKPIDLFDFSTKKNVFQYESFSSIFMYRIILAFILFFSSVVIFD